MWSFEVTGIDSIPSARDGAFSFSLDLPKTDARHGNATFEIAGWVVGANLPASAVVVSLAGIELASFPVSLLRTDVVESFRKVTSPWVASAGFSGLVKLQPHDGALALEVAVEIGGQLVPVRRIRGKLVSGYSPVPSRLAPIMLSAHGRSGTTLTMKALSTHPEIVTSRVHPYELHVAQHLVESLRSSLDYEFAYLIEPWNAFLGREFVQNAAAFCVEQIDGYYDRVARVNGQEAARFFIEKFNEVGSQAWFHTLYPQTAKEIFLVRDYRDVFASILAVNAKRESWQFVERRESDRETALGWRRPQLLLEAWRKRRSRTLLVRYEDLVLAPEQTLTRIFEYLGVDASPSVVRTVATEAVVPTSRTRAHMTTGSLAASIGRWKHDLQRDVQSALHDTVGEALLEFGYEVPPEVSRRFRQGD